MTALLPDSPYNFIAVQPWHAPIEDDQVRAALTEVQLGILGYRRTISEL